MFNKDANVKKFLSDTRLATKAIHAGHDPTEWRSRALVTPIVTSVTFACKENEPMDYLYARFGNPTRSCLERTLAALEEGQYALCFTSGMTAITAVVCLLSNGDHILSSDDVFGGSHFLMKNGVSRFQMTTTFVDCTDVEKVRRALKSNTKLVWLESPTNPLMKVLDIKAIVEAVKADRPDILIAVDNTFSTPVFQQPLNLGADIVVHSLTKYMNGHCDVCLGSIVTRNKDIYQRLSFAQRNSEYSTLGVSFCFDSVHLLYTISGESNDLKPYLFWHERRCDPTRSAEKVSEESVDLFWKTIIPKAYSSKQNSCLCVFWPTNIQNSLYKQE